jgi:hypothetical protein
LAHLDQLDRSVRFARRAGARLALGALLALCLAPAAGAQFGKNKIQYRDFDWKLYASPHFTFYYYEAEADQLEKVASLAESAYDRLTREFDHQVQDPIPMIFYATHSAFEQNNIILNFIPEGVGAFASPVRNRMVLPIDLPDGELFALISHELTHIFQYDILYRGKVSGRVGGAPQWFMEGMASYMAKDESTSDKMYLRDAVVNDSIPSILERGSVGLPRLPLRPRRLRLHRGALGQGGLPRLPVRVPQHLRRPRRPRGRARAAHRSRGFRPRLPALAAQEVPAAAGRDRRAFRLRPAVPRREGRDPAGALAGGLALGRPGGGARRHPRRPRHRALRHPHAARDRQPDEAATPAATSTWAPQFLTIGARMGRDISFSADGNFIAAFAKRERGRSLMIFDVLRAQTREDDRDGRRAADEPGLQPRRPERSPSPPTAPGRFDIYTVDLETQRSEERHRRRDLRRLPRSSRPTAPRSSSARWWARTSVSSSASISPTPASASG